MLRRHSAVRGRARIAIAVIISVGYPTDSSLPLSLMCGPRTFRPVLICIQSEWNSAEALPHQFPRGLWKRDVANWYGWKRRIFTAGCAANALGCSNLPGRLAATP